MARTWGTRIEFTTNDPADTFSTATLAVVARANAPGSGATLLAAADSGDGLQFDLQVTGASDVLEIFSVVGNNVVGTTATAALASVWCLYAATYASSGATPRFHRFRFDTGAAAHEAGDQSLTQPLAAGAAGRWIVGGSNVANWSGEIAAAGYWSYGMSDAEVDRLAAGDWASRSPKFLWEGSARDDRDLAFARDLGRLRCKLLSHTGTTRYVEADPVGFRFSTQARRR